MNIFFSAFQQNVPFRLKPWWNFRQKRIACSKGLIIVITMMMSVHWGDIIRRYWSCPKLPPSSIPEHSPTQPSYFLFPYFLSTIKLKCHSQYHCLVFAIPGKINLEGRFGGVIQGCGTSSHPIHLKSQTLHISILVLGCIVSFLMKVISRELSHYFQNVPIKI